MNASTAPARRALVSLAISVAAASYGIDAVAATFADTEFSPGNLSIDMVSSQGANVTTSQTLTGGNPGAAFDYFVTATGGTIFTETFVFENAFVYDPSASGAARSIGFSVDIWNDTPATIGSTGETLLIRQAVNTFGYFVPGNTAKGVYQTLTAADLTADDFGALGGTAAHPDFGGAPMQFGFYQGWSDPNGDDFESRVDNLRVAVSAVPEPAVAPMLAIGLLGLAWRSSARRANRRRP